MDNRIREFLNNSSGIWVYDIEANDLFYGVTTVHCIWIIDAITRASIGFRPDEIVEGLKLLEKAKVIIGHNIVDYDNPALKKLYPTFKPPASFDTLVIARMIEPDRIQGHSLDSWGKTLGVFKDEFGKTADWNIFTEEMYTYCYQDVNVNVELYLYLCKRVGFDPANPPCVELY